ncbi:MAG: hypothetical protein SV375_17020 [Thermodesulfobacteriota bacterium]|nr:hypothetical protein [Thermodesulfobacteriota bacterium]
MQEFLGYARIKNSAIVGQDMGWYEWEDRGEVFEVLSFNKEKHKLVANGYGSFKPGQKYGNGALFVKWEDIEFVERRKYARRCCDRITKRNFQSTGDSAV